MWVCPKCEAANTENYCECCGYSYNHPKSGFSGQFRQIADNLADGEIGIFNKEESVIEKIMGDWLKRARNFRVFK